LKINLHVIIEKIILPIMVKGKTCDCNDVHHTGHDFIHYKHVGDLCIHPDGHTHKIGEKR